MLRSLNPFFKLISHRGNTNGSNQKLENTPEYILEAIKQGFDVKIDLWAGSRVFFLGSSCPTTIFPENWFNDIEILSKLILHAKTQKTLYKLTNLYPNITCFSNETDKYTLMSTGGIWCHNTLSGLSKDTVYMFSDPPPIIEDHISFLLECGIRGICSDYVGLIKDIMKKTIGELI